MKFRYLTILALAFAFGCSKSGTTGDTASKTPDAPAASSTGSVTGSTSTGSATGGTPTGTTAPQASGTAGASGTGAGSPTGTSTKPMASPGKPSDPKSTPTAPGATAPNGTPGQPPQMTAAQKKQMEDFMAKQKKAIEDNGSKAEKSAKTVLDGVKGTYKGVLDESKIPAQTKAAPGYADMLAKAKANPPMVVVANDGSLTIKGGAAPQEVTGYTSKIDGKTVIVLSNPKPTAGQPSKLFIPLVVEDGGATLKVGNSTFKRS